MTQNEIVNNLTSNKSLIKVNISKSLPPYAYKKFDFLRTLKETDDKKKHVICLS